LPKWILSPPFEFSHSSSLSIYNTKRVGDKLENPYNPRRLGSSAKLKKRISRPTTTTKIEDSMKQLQIAKGEATKWK